MRRLVSVALVCVCPCLHHCAGPEFCNSADATTECGRGYFVLRALVAPSVASPVGQSAGPVSCALSTNCILFMTAAQYNGNFMGQPGIPGADQRCNGDANKPANTGTYKAMIVDGTARIASVTAGVGDGQVDWVLYNNKQYRRPDGTPIATSTAARLFTFNLTNSISTVVPGPVVWTGLNSDWTSSATNCATWTNNTVGANGFTASQDTVSSTAIQSGSFMCNSSNFLYCAQQ